jgi:riboflavin biosynthesis pyrimidine reductase
LANDRPRVLVLYEPGASGARTLDQARELISAQDGRLTVATLASRDTRVRGTGVSARDYNDAVRDSAQRELDEARRLLGPLAEWTVFEVVVEGGNRSLAAWAADGAFDIILLPARRRLFSRAGHPLAAALRDSTTADVRVVARDGATQGEG